MRQPVLQLSYLLYMSRDLLQDSNIHYLELEQNLSRLTSFELLTYLQRIAKQPKRNTYSISYIFFVFFRLPVCPGVFAGRATCYVTKASKKTILYIIAVVMAAAVTVIAAQVITCFGVVPAARRHG